MTPEELSRIREIYERVIEGSGSDRDAILQRECGGNDEIRSEVERLLEARKHVPDWLDNPVVAAVPPLPHLGLPNMEGRRLSGYTLVREIGRGGMGAIYLAERSDGVFHKQAAIKLVLPSHGSAFVMEHFQQEREILASLDHPNIARLLDGGVTEEGWPYFVMEFVDGQPIDRWCDLRKQDVSQRIELFRSVIAAVRYAHQRLVVHRDLKPGNILVTNDGTVKLLDFGIAKIVSAAEAGKLPATQTLALMMTPEYASPEQVSGASITTLSDIYSLGVTLYELLTGHRPYRLRSAAMHEIARVIAEEEPARPSEVVATTESGNASDRSLITPDTVSAVREGDSIRLRRRLAGDLDSILLMALQKEPEQRYGSAESFAEDLKRHLEHRPISAREATPLYRARRFCRRNPGAVIAVVLFAILFLSGMAAVVLQARDGIEAARLNPKPNSFFLPVLIFFTGLVLAGLSAVIYLTRPSRLQLAGASAGGVVFAVLIAGKWWLENYLGWWRSRFVSTEDPMMVLAPATCVMYALAGTALLLLLSVIGRRFGWKGQVVSILIICLAQATRERVWYSSILPALTFEPGLVPVLAGASFMLIAIVMGLVAMRFVAGPERA